MIQDFIDLCGIVGSIAFAMTGVPQMIKVIREGHARGVSFGMIYTWLLGSVCMLMYASMRYSDPVFVCNYCVNLVVISVIAHHKHFPRR